MMTMTVVLQVVDTISCLSLQRPVDVVTKLVDSAVESRGHVECVIKLLHRLPSLAQITSHDGRNVLLGRLDQHVVSCSQQSLQNITNFCRLLLVSGFQLLGLISVWFCAVDYAG